MKRGEVFKSSVGVIVPGNFVSVLISGIEGDYEVKNEDEFLDEFFEVEQKSPFTFPEVTKKKPVPEEFQIKCIDGRRKIFEIVL